jgi:hypothetical protein
MADRVVIRGFALGAVLAAGCGGPTGGTVSLVLDIPNAMLDPKGYTSVDVRLHETDGSTREISVAVDDGHFDLGTIDDMAGVMIEASLRNGDGAAVGYGRAATPVDLEDKAMVVVPVRRPIVYLSGLVSDDPDPNMADDRTWTRTKPTFYDVSTMTILDGSTQLATNALLTVSAGPRLFAIDQTPTSPSDTLVLTGTPTIKEVSTADHSISSSSLAAIIEGEVADAAGTDDGAQLVVATSLHLYLVDTETGAARPIADGEFSRVAIVSADDQAVAALAVKNRTPTGCTAELVWASANADDTNQVKSLGTSGYTDVAADGGRGFYVDGCKGGELGEATASATQMKRTGLGTPTALAVSNGQAWVGLEKTGGITVQSMPVDTTDMPRTLFDEAASQVVESRGYPGLLRRLDAVSASFVNLEIGAGGDYVAWALAATYHGDAYPDAYIPQIDIDTQELRMIDTSTGALILNYRSVCEGTFTPTDPFFDIQDWACSLSPGQLEASDSQYDHRINGMTFQFGKK